MSTGSDWVDQAKRLVDTFLASPAVPADAPAGGTAHADSCRWCPLCQVSAVARGERPEVSAALADVLTATASALRAFADHGAQPPAPSAEAATETGPDEEPGPAVQRIEIA